MADAGDGKTGRITPNEMRQVVHDTLEYVRQTKENGAADSTAVALTGVSLAIMQVGAEILEELQRANALREQTRDTLRALEMTLRGTGR